MTNTAGIKIDSKKGGRPGRGKSVPAARRSGMAGSAKGARATAASGETREFRKGAGPSNDWFRRLVDMGIALLAQQNKDKLMAGIVREAQSITGADGGALYLLTEAGRGRLEFAVMAIRSLDIRLDGATQPVLELPYLDLYDSSGNPNRRNLAAYTAITGELCNVPDAYSSPDWDFTGLREFDERIGYRTSSILTAPLKNYREEVIGVLQLFNAREPWESAARPFETGLEPVLETMTAFAAVALDNQILIEGHKNLLDAFVVVLAKAIDAKSSHTGAHCERVPELTEMLAQAACRQQSGPFSQFDLSDHDWYELHVAAWLHDCGKLSTPDHILDKATKLHTLTDGIELVRTRLEVARRDLELDLLRQTAGCTSRRRQILERRHRQRLAGLEADREFLERVNVGGESMTAEDQARIRKLALLTWVDSTGAVRPLLEPWEVEHLCIPRGTLTDGERKAVNDHIAVTIDMLESLPFPKQLRRVPEIAGGHHERMDGTGFPKGLKREEMSVAARMMGVADVFEALTSRERPYKQAMKLSQALSILRDMRDRAHIDPDVYRLFLQAGVWRRYAEKFLDPAQIDVDDIGQYL